MVKMKNENFFLKFEIISIFFVLGIFKHKIGHIFIVTKFIHIYNIHHSISQL